MSQAILPWLSPEYLSQDPSTLPWYCHEELQPLSEQIFRSIREGMEKYGSVQEMRAKIKAYPGNPLTNESIEFLTFEDLCMACQLIHDNQKEKLELLFEIDRAGVKFGYPDYMYCSFVVLADYLLAVDSGEYKHTIDPDSVRELALAKRADKALFSHIVHSPSYVLSDNSHCFEIYSILVEEYRSLAMQFLRKRFEGIKDTVYLRSMNEYSEILYSVFAFIGSSPETVTAEKYLTYLRDISEASTIPLDKIYFWAVSICIKTQRERILSFFLGTSFSLDDYRARNYEREAKHVGTNVWYRSCLEYEPCMHTIMTDGAESMMKTLLSVFPGLTLYLDINKMVNVYPLNSLRMWYAHGGKVVFTGYRGRIPDKKELELIQQIEGQLRQA